MPGGGTLTVMSETETSKIGADLLDNPDRPDQNSGAAAGRQRETHMGFARSLATILFIIALPVAIVTTNIRVLANAPVVYNYAFDRYNAEDATGLSRPDIDSTAKALRQYFNNDEKTFYHQVTEDGLPASVFNARETRHMEDVKRLFVWVNRIQEVSIVFVLAYAVVFFIWSHDADPRQLAGQSMAGVALGTLGVGAIGVVAAFGFDAAFTRFHEVLFTNDFWQLNPQTDHLLQMFPEGFWRDITVALGAMCAIEAAVIVAVAGIYLLATRRERRRIVASVDLNASNPQAA